MKKLAVVINFIIFSQAIYAVDYKQPINGSKTFEDGDTVTVSSGTSAISDSTTGGTGIQVNNDGTFKVNAPDSITTAIGLSNKVANALGKGSSITSNGNGFATGIEISGSGTSLTATDITVTAQSQSSNSGIGLNITQGANVHLKGNSAITATGTGGQIYASPNDKASFTTDKVTIVATGTNSTGVHTEQNTEVDLGDGSLIKATGSNATAIENFQGHITAKNLTIIQDSSAGTMGKAMDIRGTTEIEGGSISSTNGNGVSVFQGGTLNYKNGAITTTGNGTYTLLS